MKILIAEDSEIARLVLERAIQRLGYQLQVACNGLEAWELFQESQVDVVISDWIMPGIDGIELCRRVRAQSRPHYTYFIFITALGEKDHITQAMDAGADDCLTKPLNLVELRIRLRVADRFTSLYRKVVDQRGELERLNTELFEQSRRDALTKLGNRLCLQEDIETLRASAARYGHDYSVVMFDVDHFKAYNDRYGHPAGDLVLSAVAQATLASIRKGGDAAYRYGGEEFLVTLAEQRSEGAAVAAEHMRAAVQALAIPHAGNAPGVVTISAGVATSLSGENKDAATLFQEADDALYQAKAQGRNCLVVYRAGMPIAG